MIPAFITGGLLAIGLLLAFALTRTGNQPASPGRHRPGQAPTPVEVTAPVPAGLTIARPEPGEQLPPASRTTHISLIEVVADRPPVLPSLPGRALPAELRSLSAWEAAGRPVPAGWAR